MSRPKTLKSLALLATLTACLGSTLVGCQSAQVKNTIDPAIIASHTDDDQMTFWHELAQRPMVANDEAFHAILLFVDGQDQNENYEARVAGLKSRKMLPGSFNAAADQAITRGDLAVAIVGVLNIKGGVMLRLTGPNRRYAMRELVYQGIYPDSSEYQTFTGQQFVGIIGKAEDYQRENLRAVAAVPVPTPDSTDSGMKTSLQEAPQAPDTSGVQ